MLHNSSGGCGGTSKLIDRVDAWLYFSVVVHSEYHTMATGTNETELDELKETVRQMGNRIEILSAQNSDLNSRLLKAKETFDTQTSLT